MQDPHHLYPCLWFENKAKEAVTFYCSVFKNSRILSENPFVVMFELRGTKFMALNGRKKFEFNESVSFVVNCDSQEEIDLYWERLTAEGSESMCGWLKDKYGVSWQIVPTILGELMNDPLRATRVTEAFLKMKKFDIETLLKA